MMGKAQAGSASWLKAVTSVKKSTGNEIMTHQCATRIHGRFLKALCDSVSFIVIHRRGPTGVRRPGATVPIRATVTICHNPRRKIPAHARVIKPAMMSDQVGNTAAFLEENCLISK